MNVTDKSLALFLRFAREAGHWNGTPLLDISKEERGNLTQLKTEGLVSTFKDEGCEWIRFSPAGVALAASHGFEI